MTAPSVQAKHRHATQDPAPAPVMPSPQPHGGALINGRFACCALIPTYNNGHAVTKVVAAIRPHLKQIIVVDDGSNPESRDIIAGLGRDGLAIVHHHEHNQGKGAAVCTGLELALAHGFTHAFQIDGDGQHDCGQIPAFLKAAEAEPHAAIFGYPHYGDDAPRGRVVGRNISRFWVHIETGGRLITDPMVGFRIYPVERTLHCKIGAPGMAYDIEAAVRLAWAGVRIRNLPVAVRYFSDAEGGVSHFRMFRDNLRITWCHTCLCTAGILRWFMRGLRAALRVRR